MLIFESNHESTDHDYLKVSYPMPLENTNQADGVKRVSISMPQEIYEALDVIIAKRGFKSRSQAISEMVAQNVAKYSGHIGDDVVAGTIMLVYDDSRPGLHELLAEIQRKNISEVLSSQHIFLEKNFTMEVLLVQGPANKLQDITNELVSCKGVRSANLTLTSLILPPIHPHNS